MRHSVVVKRLGYEASAGWTTYGTSLAAFSLFQGVATRHESSSEIRPRSDDFSRYGAVTTKVVTTWRLFIVSGHRRFKRLS